MFPIDAAALKLSHQLEFDGWLKTAAFLQDVSDFSQLAWLAILLVVGIVMPSRIRRFVTTIRNHEDPSSDVSAEDQGAEPWL